MKRGDPLYFAQIRVPRHHPPVVRLVVGAYYGPHKNGRDHRITVRHARFPIDAKSAACSENLQTAQRLLAVELETAIAHHRTAISQLQEAHAAYMATAALAWPSTPTPAEQSLGIR